MHYSKRWRCHDYGRKKRRRPLFNQLRTSETGSHPRSILTRLAEAIRNNAVNVHAHVHVDDLEVLPPYRQPIVADDDELYVDQLYYSRDPD